MDKITRPRQAARRMSRSLSSSPLDLDDHETDEESLPSSARSNELGDESGGSDSEDDGTVQTLISREPDPNATRRSSRAAAQKPVNYSCKYHPQDFALPGHQHKVQVLKRQQHRQGRSHNARSQERNNDADEDRADNEDDEFWVSNHNVTLREVAAVEVVSGVSRASQEVEGRRQSDRYSINAMQTNHHDTETSRGHGEVPDSDGDPLEDFHAAMQVQFEEHSQTDDLPSTEPNGPLQPDEPNIDEFIDYGPTGRVYISME